MTKTESAVIKAISVAVIALAVIMIFAIAFISVRCADKSELTVMLNGKKLYNHDKIVIPMTGEAKFEYSATEGDINATVSISGDFEYYADGKSCHARELDLTPLFISDETKTESGFTLQCMQNVFDLSKVLSEAHGGAEITGYIPELSYPFRLTVATTAGKLINIYFAQINISLSQTGYVF